jgi:hypothetical protein
MLEYLAGKASERKLRLYAVACCRRVKHLLPPKFLAFLEIAKEVAEGQINGRERDKFREKAQRARGKISSHSPFEPAQTAALFAKQAVREALSRQATKAAEWAFHNASMAAMFLRSKPWRRVTSSSPDRRLTLEKAWFVELQKIASVELSAFSGLLRDVFGPVLFFPIALNRTWLSWNGSTVRNLAQAIYDEHRFTDLPILADALEEAGCDNADVLAHCRQPGEHVRGCWVLDLLLGKS